MTANRAEKGGGSMAGGIRSGHDGVGDKGPGSGGGPTTSITTAEQRAALEAAGWHKEDRRYNFEAWRYKDEGAVITLFKGTAPLVQGPWELVGPALVILGITLPGYVMVPVENIYEANVVLNEAIGEKQLLDTALSGERDTSDEERAQRKGEHKEWAADLRKRFTALLPR